MAVPALERHVVGVAQGTVELDGEALFVLADQFFESASFEVDVMEMDAQLSSRWY